MKHVERHRQRLQELEAAALARTDRAREASASMQQPDQVNDSGDASMADELADETLIQAQVSSATLDEIRAALTRIDNGTYGNCVVDGEPIEPARLDAVPWAAYCLKHAEDAESGDPARQPTL